ncbi:MAG: hypothetical protein IKI97_07960 [Clostridia bacterium]|nr:hypothetical protein [Clostridia bacterium]
MKKFLTLALCALMAMSTVLVGCNNNSKNDENNNEPNAVAPNNNDEGSNESENTVKFGAGVYTSAPSAVDATENKEGTGEIEITAAALTVDADGKIAACELDTASYTVNFTLDGKAIASEFKTKYELGKDYNMVAYGGAKKEWFEQADTFEAVVVGKTLDEVKALVAEGNKGTEEVTTAGCTIMINEFVSAIEKAYKAADTEISADTTLELNFATEQTCTDATEEKNGSNDISAYVFAAAFDADSKVVAASSDCVDVSFTFDANGVSTLDTTKPVLSKMEQGMSYGMVAYGGATKEWFEQADAFDAACIGKTKEEIAGLLGDDGKGNSDLQTAGCTINVTGFIKAATK